MLGLPTLQAMADNGPQVDERHGSAYKNEFNREDHFRKSSVRVLAFDAVLERRAGR
jgi:hypothetical protein